LGGELRVTAGGRVDVVGDVGEAGEIEDLADEGAGGGGGEISAELVVVGERLVTFGHPGDEIVDVGPHGVDQVGGLVLLSSGGAEGADLLVDLVEVLGALEEQ